MVGRGAVAQGAVVKKLLCVLCLALTGCAASRPQGAEEGDPVMETLLHAIGLRLSDVSIPGDTLDDPDRPALTRQLLEHPLTYETAIHSLSGKSARETLTSGAHLIDIAQPAPHRETPDLPLPDDIPLPLRQLIQAIAQCHRDVEVAGFAPEEREQLGELMALVHPGFERTEAEAEALIALGRRVDRTALVHAALHMLDAIDIFLSEPVDLSPMQLETPMGLVIIGTTGDDVYDTPAALIIDPGGNDRYESVAGVALPDLPVSVCIDLGGDDVYLGPQALGIGGIGIVVDVSGNDTYDGTGQGAGIAGVGILDDRAGDDAYRGSVGCQGFGLYGAGLLFDGAGDDRYEASLLGQGAAGPGGLGLLADVSGNDRYTAGGEFPDIREDGQFYQSMAQGFALGIRPITSGGIGILLDMAGDDAYRAEYFAQGASFWGGTGLLIDRAGNDRYEARRYAQGAGVHLAVGALIDLSGDDTYHLWGVGQGCGHDLSVGLLIDRAGNDRYEATFLAQGAGHANGIGILDDGGGNYQYIATHPDAQGSGAPARGFGSIGLLIDRGGNDDYEGPGAPGRLWRGGPYGGGIDWPIRNAFGNENETTASGKR